MTITLTADEARKIKEPSFGDRVTMIYASERNPIKHGIFVRSFERRGKLNPGTIYQITDGKGNFWEANKDSVALLNRADGGAG